MKTNTLISILLAVMVILALVIYDAVTENITDLYYDFKAQQENAV